MGFNIQQVDPLLTLVALEKTAFKNSGRDYTEQSEMFMYLLQMDALVESKEERLHSSIIKKDYIHLDAK